MTAQLPPDQDPRAQAAPDERRPRVVTSELMRELRRADAAARAILDDPASYVDGVVPAERHRIGDQTPAQKGGSR